MEVSLIKNNGALKININDEIIEPLSFKSFRPTKKNISDFYNSGVKLFSILSSGMTSMLGVKYSLFGESWLGCGQYDFKPVDNQIELFISNAPDAYFALMIQLDTRPWWLEKNPTYPNSFTHLSQTAYDSLWRCEATKYLKAIISHVEEKYSEKIYGYFLLGGMTTEWFSSKDYEESSPMKYEAFKEYTNNKNAVIPTPSQRELSSDITFIDNENLVSYRKFHNELIADTILYFAKKAQEVLNHKKLIGVYFGYVLELSGERLWNDGHIAYEKIFTSSDIDMISSPSSYAYRDYDSTSAFMVTYDTLKMHNKLYYLEFDHITHLAPKSIEGIMIPGGNSKFKNEFQTIDVMRRDFMLCLSKGVALWWFDMFEGWFYSKSMMREIENMIAISKKISENNMENLSEIAVFVDPNSLYYVNKNANVNTELIFNQRDGLSKMGSPYDMYSICDLDKIEHKKYKLFIFLNSFKISLNQKKIINTKIKKNNSSILWIYAPNYINDNGFSANGIEEISNIKVTKTFQINDNDCVNIDNNTLIGYKKFEEYTSIYSSVGNLSSDILRKILEISNIHIYNKDNCPVYINNQMLGIYNKEATKLYVLENCVYKDVFSSKIYKASNGIIEIPKEHMRAKLLLKIKNFTEEQ